jgi:hypothetical protein
MCPGRELGQIQPRSISKLAQITQEPHCIIDFRRAGFQT